MSGHKTSNFKWEYNKESIKIQEKKNDIFNVKLQKKYLQLDK